jgi:release factor glutamine methyltransferase
LYLGARRALREAGITGYDLEARLLTAAASHRTKEQFLRDRHHYDTDGSYEAALNALIDRRLRGEPIAYILGEWEFYGLPLDVTPDVLIPRIDTEVLVDAVLEHIRTRRVTAPRVLDLCAGTGCVGLAIAANAADARVLLGDISPAALRVCRRNIHRNNLIRRVTTMELDALKAPPVLIGSFDVIACNPPYIPTGDIAWLDESVRGYEPAAALDGGEDGLLFYRGIVPKWKETLTEGGLMAFECGIGQAPFVAEVLHSNGLEDIRTYKDTLDIERVVTGIRRRGGPPEGG